MLWSNVQLCKIFSSCQVRISWPLCLSYCHLIAVNLKMIVCLFITQVFIDFGRWLSVEFTKIILYARCILYEVLFWYKYSITWYLSKHVTPLNGSSKISDNSGVLLHNMNWCFQMIMASFTYCNSSFYFKSWISIFSSRNNFKTTCIKHDKFKMSVTICPCQNSTDLDTNSKSVFLYSFDNFTCEIVTTCMYCEISFFPLNTSLCGSAEPCIKMSTKISSRLGDA